MGLTASLPRQKESGRKGSLGAPVPALEPGKPECLLLEYLHGVCRFVHILLSTFELDEAGGYAGCPKWMTMPAQQSPDWSSTPGSASSFLGHPEKSPSSQSLSLLTCNRVHRTLLGNHCLCSFTKRSHEVVERKEASNQMVI